MNDMSSVIIPKSDQINADTLLAGPMTVTIREVQIRGGQEQPVSIMLDETELAYRPCKSMSRVLVGAWGPDAKQYVGRRLTLYRDPTVKWAGMEVGGIRISHMSHIDGKLQMQLTATKGQRKPHVVLPLADAPAPTPRADAARNWATGFVNQVNAAPDLPTLENFVASKAAKLEELKTKRPELHAECEAAVADRRASFAGDEDTFDDEDSFEDETSDNAGGEPQQEPVPTVSTLAPDQERYVTNLRKQIDEAADKKALDAADKAWTQSRALFDDATAAEIDGLIAAKRKALAPAKAD